MTKTYRKDPDAIARLTAEQFRVTQQSGTEGPFSGEFDEHFEDGLYVDIVSGEPLFSSRDKFNSGCGWPAFAKSLDKNVNEIRDSSHGMVRTEVRSVHGDSHLGLSLTTDRASWAVCVIASTRPRCASFRKRILRRKVTANI